jgi:hypothetical protein
MLRVKCAMLRVGRRGVFAALRSVPARLPFAVPDTCPESCPGWLMVLSDLQFTLRVTVWKNVPGTAHTSYDYGRHQLPYSNSPCRLTMTMSHGQPNLPYTLTSNTVNLPDDKLAQLSIHPPATTPRLTH